jgi:hypothetical protein
MTLNEEEERYQAGLRAGNNPTDVDDDVDAVGASVPALGPAGGFVGCAPFPTGFGSATTPMYFKSIPTPKTTAISPYGNFLDISSKEQKLLWREMVKPSADFVPLDMTVANSKAIIDLFTDKAITFRWMRYM